MIVYRTFEAGFIESFEAVFSENGIARAEADPDHGRDRGAAEHDLRRPRRDRAGPPELPRQGAPQHARSTSRSRSPRSSSASRCCSCTGRASRSASGSLEQRDPDHLLDAGHRDRLHLRLAAVRRPRGRSRPPGDRRRAGAGRRRRSARTGGRPSGGSPCRRSAGASPTASSSRRRASSASSARSASSPAGSPARPRPCRCSSAISSRRLTEVRGYAAAMVLAVDRADGPRSR